MCSNFKHTQFAKQSTTGLLCCSLQVSTPRPNILAPNISAKGEIFSLFAHGRRKPFFQIFDGAGEHPKLFTLNSSPPKNLMIFICNCPLKTLSFFNVNILHFFSDYDERRNFQNQCFCCLQNAYQSTRYITNHQTF